MGLTPERVPVGWCVEPAEHTRQIGQLACLAGAGALPTELRRFSAHKDSAICMLSAVGHRHVVVAAGDILGEEDSGFLTATPSSPGP